MQQANGELEEEIIRIMQEVDSLKGQIEVREADIAITEEDWNKKHQQLKEQIHSAARSKLSGAKKCTLSAGMTRRIRAWDVGQTFVCVIIALARDTILHTLYS